MTTQPQTSEEKYISILKSLNKTSVEDTVFILGATLATITLNINAHNDTNMDVSLLIHEIEKVAIQLVELDPITTGFDDAD